MEKERQETASAQQAHTVKTTGMAAGAARFVKTAVISVILVMLGVFSWIIDFPWYLGAVLVGTAVAILLLQVLTLKRVVAVDLEQLNTLPSDFIPLEPDEELTAVIPGVMQYGKVRSYAVLGTGKVVTSENALLLTNKAVWALTVPLPGVDKVVSGVDIGKWQWMTTANDIAEVLQKMISSQTLEEVLRQSRAVRLMNREELKTASVAPLSQSLVLESRDGKKYSYSIRQKEVYLRAAQTFTDFR